MFSIVQAGLADAALLAQAAAAWALASLADSLAHLPSPAQPYQDHVGVIAEGECRVLEHAHAVQHPGACGRRSAHYSRTL